MPKPSSNDVFSQLLDRIGNVVPKPWDIGETQIQDLGVIAS